MEPAFAGLTPGGGRRPLTLRWGWMSALEASLLLALAVAVTVAAGLILAGFLRATRVAPDRDDDAGNGR